MSQTSGHIFGDLLSTPPKHTTTSLVIGRFMSPSNGCGSLHIRTSTKFFFWLLLKDRPSTKELLQRRNMVPPDYTCVCCVDREEESLAHLFINCSFAQACWASIGLLVTAVDSFDTLMDLKNQLAVPFFMEVIIILSWCIWM